MKWFIVISMILCVGVDSSLAQSSSGFFGSLAANFAQIFRRSTTIPTEFIYETSTYFVTEYQPVTVTETSTTTLTSTETSTLSLSWLRWTTETEREFVTETLTETTTTVDVSLLVSVAVVTLTERSTSYMTTTATVLSATTQTIYSDLTFTEPAPNCPTYTVTLQKMPQRPSPPELKQETMDIDDLNLEHAEKRQVEFKDVDIDDLDLVEGFLRRSSGSLV